MMQRIYRAGDDHASATVTQREGECRSTLVANGGAHVGVCGACDQPAKKIVSYFSEAVGGIENCLCLNRKMLRPNFELIEMSCDECSR